jgi:hypothetical protein
VVREAEPDSQDIHVEECYGDLDLRVVSSDVREKGNENQKNKQENVTPEQTGINSTGKMELPVMIQPDLQESKTQ